MLPLSDLEAAAARIAGAVRRTPLLWVTPWPPRAKVVSLCLRDWLQRHHMTGRDE